MNLATNDSNVQVINNVLQLGDDSMIDGEKLIVAAYRLIDKSIKLSKNRWSLGAPPIEVVSECKRLGITIEYSYTKLAT